MNEDIKKAIEVLKYHQEWRKGAEIPQTDVKKLTNALDTAIEILSKWQDSERWRKVEEELPDDNITVLLEIEYDGITDCSTGHFYDKGKKYHLDSELYKDAIITCWKPIH